MNAPRSDAALAALIAIGSVLAFLLAIAIVGSVFDVPFGWFFRDPTVTLEGHPLTGVSSSVGVLTLVAGASIGLFAAATPSGGASGQRRFLAVNGGLTALLALDDLFLVHDDLVVRYLGLSDRYVYVVYAALFGLFAVAFRGVLLDRGNRLLPLALLLMVASVVVDQLHDMLLPSLSETEWRVFLEDGLKLMGYACWTAGLILIAWRVLGLHTLEPASPDAATSTAVPAPRSG